MLDKNGIFDLRIGKDVRVRRSWCSPLGGRSGIVAAIDPNDRYGEYLIQFEDGLQFRYERRDLELDTRRALWKTFSAYISDLKKSNRD